MQEANPAASPATSHRQCPAPGWAHEGACNTGGTAAEQSSISAGKVKKGMTRHAEHPLGCCLPLYFYYFLIIFPIYICFSMGKPSSLLGLTLSLIQPSCNEKSPPAH